MTARPHKVPNNLHHMMWGWGGSMAIQPIERPTKKQSEGRLSSVGPGEQIEPIDRARRAVKDHCRLN
ncbi:hypothetical protein HPB47_014432 [Ixodes persulcatus]|uniref:Uncharacterized protein n=1 Tax=Ixodes persulcatus TaxID=34615 RepID=A0AC60QZM3_IXOPE|nr:hypothetical protein HPB47_014432 [Ixodes persulcatus]